MELKEAILHCKEVYKNSDNKKCALEHKQLAEWLEELHKREQGCDRCRVRQSCSICIFVDDECESCVGGNKFSYRYKYCPECGRKLVQG